MYPPLYVARGIQRSGHRVKYHATTRSPIAVSQESEYPLHERYELASLYDRDRKTYLYDLAHYDMVFIITDAPQDKERDSVRRQLPGLASLENALRSSGNENIYCVRWCKD